MTKIHLQAVILCGGLGTRLLPVTKNLPKPMVIINDGKPFLLYLLEQLSSQGIKDFVLLTGYLSDKIKDFFKDGSSWGWQITYSEGPVKWDTGRRLWEAKNKIKPNFMLLYSDNFATIPFEKIIKKHQQEKNIITLLIKKKLKGNIEIKDNKIINYAPLRNRENLKFVELGYMLARKKELFTFFEKINSFPNFNFSKILEILVNQNKVSFEILHSEYYSISDLKRLELTKKYLSVKKILLLDRDGTINKRAPIGEYIKTISEVNFIYKTIKALKELSKKGFVFIVISNQACIARGIVSKDEVNIINKYIEEKLLEHNIDILKFYICPHHWDEGCNCRKPNPELFFQFSKEFNARLDKTLYVGDDIRDCYAAENAGSQCVFVGSKKEIINTKFKQFFFQDLLTALPYIENFYKNETV